jgi:hypothetical protein
VIVAALLAGFRHAVRVPAELAASWAVQVAWLGDTRRHIAGAKAAGALLFVLLPVAALWPFYAVMFSPRDATWIAICTSAGGLVVLETVFLGYHKLPFTCGYLPGDLKTLAPIVFAAFCFCTYQFAHIERALLQSGDEAALAAVLLGLFGALRVGDAVRRRHPQPFEFDEMPAPPTQRLGLS